MEELKKFADWINENCYMNGCRLQVYGTLRIDIATYYMEKQAKNNESLHLVSCCDEKIKVGQVWKEHSYGSQGKIVILKIENDDVHFSSLDGASVCELVQVWKKNRITALFSLRDDMYINIK